MNQISETAGEVIEWLAQHGPATAREIAHACEIEVSSVRGRLVILEKEGHVSGRLNGAVPPQRVYSVADQNRRTRRP